MSWLTDPAERMPTEDEIELLQFELAKEIIRSGRDSIEKHRLLQLEMIEDYDGN